MPALDQSRRPAAVWHALKVDPRWLVAGFLTIFALVGQVYLGFFQDWRKAAAAIITALVTELVMVRLTSGKWILPLSAYITGTGLSLLLSSPFVWTYAAASFLAIASKRLLRWRGRHIYNPNNFAMVLLLAVFPLYAVSTPKQWTGAIGVMAAIFVLGLLVCWRVGRLDVVLAYGAAFVAMGLVRYYVLGTPLFAALGPLMGASLQLFMFFMITDPQTAPRSMEGRIIYGLVIAALDACVRMLRIPNAPFYALFLTCTVTNLVLAGPVAGLLQHAGRQSGKANGKAKRSRRLHKR